MPLRHHSTLGDSSLWCCLRASSFAWLNHAMLLLPAACGLRSVVHKVGRTSNTMQTWSSNSSMSSICVFFVYCMFLWQVLWFDLPLMVWVRQGVLPLTSPLQPGWQHLTTIEINRLSEPDSMVPASAFVQPPGCLSICPHCGSKRRTSRRCLGWSLCFATPYIVLWCSL